MSPDYINWTEELKEKYRTVSHLNTVVTSSTKQCICNTESTFGNQIIQSITSKGYKVNQIFRKLLRQSLIHMYRKVSQEIMNKD